MYLVILAEGLLAFATFEAAVAIFVSPEVAERMGFLESDAWIYWLVGWATVRAVAGVLAMSVTKPALWVLPLLVLICEIDRFASSLPIVLNTLGGIQLSLLWEFALRVPVRSMLIPALVPIVLAPLLALQTYWLLAEGRRRHAV